MIIDFRYEDFIFLFSHIDDQSNFEIGLFIWSIFSKVCFPKQFEIQYKARLSVHIVKELNKLHL